MKRALTLKVNGESHEAFVDPVKTLVQVLRDDIGLTGTKEGCDTGSCGGCTVLIDGKAVKSCLVLSGQAEGKEITTIEGLSQDGRLHAIQQAFLDNFGVQCGDCTPGMIMRTKELLDDNPDPTEDEVKTGLTGNYCRCTGYVKIVDSVLAASRMMKGEGK